MNAQVFLGAGLAVFLAGCGGCGAAGIPVDEMPREVAKAYCTKVFECCMANEAGAEQYGTDVASCEEKIRPQFETTRSFVKTGQAKERIQYDGQKLSDCVGALKVATCAAMKRNQTSPLTACESSWMIPKVAVGSACGYDRECINGTCDGESLDKGDGTCRAFVAESQDCDAGVCGSGLICDNSKKCVKTKADGQACNANFECSTGGCNGRDAGVPGACGEKGGAGTQCFTTQGCSSSGGSAGFAWLLIPAAALLMLLRRRAV